MRAYKKDKYKYGNIDQYYKSRNPGQWSDARLALMSRCWFASRNVVDIGSNDGTFTILVASNFDPAHITGIELDPRLVNRAVENLAYVEKVRTQLVQSHEQIAALEEFQSFPLSFRSYIRIPNHVMCLEPLIKLKQAISTQGSFPSNLSFRVANALEADYTADTVLLLSTSKWIHLNWGDEGIKKLFSQVYERLSPGGIFVFEPQDWKSYKKTKVKSKELCKSFEAIGFRPEEFQDYLTGLGFELDCVRQPNLENKNFDRKVFVYRKA